MKSRDHLKTCGQISYPRDILNEAEQFASESANKFAYFAGKL